MTTRYWEWHYSDAHAFVDIKNDSGYEIQLVKDFCKTLHSNCKYAALSEAAHCHQEFDFDIALPVLEKDIQSVHQRPTIIVMPCWLPKKINRWITL